MSILPPAASTLADRFDAVFYVVLGVTGTVAVAIAVVVVVFSIRYRAGSRASRDAGSPEHQAKVRRRLEVAWTLIPLTLFVGAFAWAANVYIDRSTAPADAMAVYVVAKQWMWKLQHENGVREIDEMHVPRGVPVRVVLTSQDVIHSFFVPAFRVKQDVLPGRYTMLWFTATRTGEFHLFCAEYCGTDHAGMHGRIIVMEPEDFARWLATRQPPSDMAARGAALFREFGCSGCHGPQSSVHAPPLEGLYGKPVPLADGTTVVADDRYLRDSILLPRKEIAAGYEPIMPSFAGQIGEEDLLDVIAYLQHLGTSAPPPGSR